MCNNTNNKMSVNKRNKLLYIHITDIIDKIRYKKYWNIEIHNLDTVFDNFNYSCVFYFVTHYLVFTTEICNHYNCCECMCKASNTKIDYIKRTKLINKLINYKERKCPNKTFKLSDIIILYLYHIRNNIHLIKFACPYCYVQDYPSYKDFNITDKQIIRNAYDIRYNHNNNKWINHKTDKEKLKINNI